MAASSAAVLRGFLGGLAGRFGFAFGLQARSFGAGGLLGGLLALPFLLALPARLGDRPQLGLPFLIFLVAGSRLLLEPLKQGLLRFRGPVETVLHARALGAAPHSYSLHFGSRLRQARTSHVGEPMLM